MRSCIKLARYAAVETRYPGQTCSVTAHPPTSSRRSSTTTLWPARARYAAVTSPLWPPPTIATSNRFPLMRLGRIPFAPQRRGDAENTKSQFCALDSCAPPECHHRQRGQCDRDAVRPPVPLDGPRCHATVSHIGSAKALGVRIEHLVVDARRRHAELVSGAHHRREVAAEQQKVIRVRGPSNKRNDRVFDIVEIHPLESGVMK